MILPVTKSVAGVDKTLKGFGFRIQKSVFECRLTRRTKQELVAKLEQLEIKTGFVKLYRLEYSNKSISIGDQAKPGLDNAPAFVL